MVENVLVVIRSAQERTLASCKDIVQEQVPFENIVTIQEVPFRKAVEKNFQLGYESGLKWTLALDADILLASDAVKKMADKFESLPDSFFNYQGFISDKLFGRPRTGGPHLYRSSLLSRALAHLTNDPSEPRPESATYKQMAQDGFHYYHDIAIYGVHDFEQHYSDIFRKGFFYARKHTHEREILVNHWIRHCEADITYQVALLGFAIGMVEKDAVEVDINYFRRKYEENKHLLPQLEQEESGTPVDSSWVDSIIARQQQEEYWSRVLQNRWKFVKRSDAKSRRRSYALVMHKLGRLMEIPGQWLIRLAEKEYL